MTMASSQFASQSLSQRVNRSHSSHQASQSRARHANQHSWLALKSAHKYVYKQRSNLDLSPIILIVCELCRVCTSTFFFFVCVYQIPDSLVFSTPFFLYPFSSCSSALMHSIDICLLSWLEHNLRWSLCWESGLPRQWNEQVVNSIEATKWMCFAFKSALNMLVNWCV